MSSEQGCLCGGGVTYVFERVGGEYDTMELPIYAASEADAWVELKVRLGYGPEHCRLLGTGSGSNFRSAVEDDELPNDLREEVLEQRRRTERAMSRGAR